MALSELVALETAYQALQPLNPAARRRSMHWLTDALELGEDAPGSVPFVGEKQESPTVEVLPAVLSTARSSEPEGSPVEMSSEESQPIRPPVVRSNSHRAGRTRSAKRAKAGEKDGTKDRVYRRMPSPKDVLDAYAQVGTISGLAEFFDVPRHTVQGWARRLRSAGYVIGRGA